MGEVTTSWSRSGQSWCQADTCWGWSKNNQVQKQHCVKLFCSIQMVSRLPSTQLENLNRCDIYIDPTQYLGYRFSYSRIILQISYITTSRQSCEILYNIFGVITGWFLTHHFSHLKERWHWGDGLVVPGCKGHSTKSPTIRTFVANYMRMRGGGQKIDDWWHHLLTAPRVQLCSANTWTWLKCLNWNAKHLVQVKYIQI